MKKIKIFATATNLRCSHVKLFKNNQSVTFYSGMLYEL